MLIQNTLKYYPKITSNKVVKKFKKKDELG